MPAVKINPISAAEISALFTGLEKSPGLLLAVSGGPDSTALMVLAARWRKSLKKKPKLLAATIDHGLRKESRREALAVAKLAKRLNIAHRVLKWTGSKPATGIQQNARAARYRLLAAEAKRVAATHILTAHTLDDQAETVIIRMARGSGITGLGAMARRSRLEGLILTRPLLDVPKARLVDTLRAAKISYADDPSNRDPKFTRARLRGLMPALAREGLDARRLSVLARRLRRADAAIEAETDRAMAELAIETQEPKSIAFDAAKFSRLPAEIALRLAARSLSRLGSQGPVELGKLEALLAEAAPAIQTSANPKASKVQFRRSLAGALLGVAGGKLIVEPAPARRKASSSAVSKPATKPLTTGKRRPAARPKAQ